MRAGIDKNRDKLGVNSMKLIFACKLKKKSDKLE
jgi:hypothetical protein